MKNDKNDIDVVQRRKDMALLTQQGMSLPKIAAKYGISRQRVSQLLQCAAKEGHKIVLRSCGSRNNKDKNYFYRPTQKEIGITKDCKVCGTTFVSKYRSTKTCSKPCSKILIRTKVVRSGLWSRYENIELVCNGCGKTFERSKYRDSISRIGCGAKNSYCSKKCYQNHNAPKEGSIIKSYAGCAWPSYKDKE